MTTSVYGAVCGATAKKVQERERVEREEADRGNCTSTAVCILFTSVTHSTDTDIKTEVKRWCDVNMRVCRSILRFVFAENCPSVAVKIDFFSP